jgi:hypothetical protein
VTLFGTTADMRDRPPQEVGIRAPTAHRPAGRSRQQIAPTSSRRSATVTIGNTVRRRRGSRDLPSVTSRPPGLASAAVRRVDRRAGGGHASEPAHLSAGDERGSVPVVHPKRFRLHPRRAVTRAGC